MPAETMNDDDVATGAEPGPVINSIRPANRRRGSSRPIIYTDVTMRGLKAGRCARWGLERQPACVMVGRGVSWQHI